MFNDKETLRKLNRFLKENNCYSSFTKNYLKAEKDDYWQEQHSNCCYSSHPSDLIMNGFKWATTKERHDYWEKIHRLSIQYKYEKN